MCVCYPSEVRELPTQHTCQGPWLCGACLLLSPPFSEALRMCVGGAGVTQAVPAPEHKPVAPKPHQCRTLLSII
jgi:hypothetical protein